MDEQDYLDNEDYAEGDEQVYFSHASVAALQQLHEEIKGNPAFDEDDARMIKACIDNEGRKLEQARSLLEKAIERERVINQYHDHFEFSKYFHPLVEELMDKTKEMRKLAQQYCPSINELEEETLLHQQKEEEKQRQQREQQQQQQQQRQHGTPSTPRASSTSRSRRSTRATDYTM